MRGQALIYGHAAGCNFISASHCLVVGAALIFFIILVACRRNSAPDTKNPSNGSVRSLRGSIAGQSMASSFGPRAKPTITLIVFSTIMFLFVLITAIVTLSGYAVTCKYDIFIEEHVQYVICTVCKLNIILVLVRNIVIC